MVVADLTVTRETRPARAPAPVLARAPHDDYLAVRTFGSLDGLRCLSILAVIWHHAAFDRLGIGRLDERGFLGVDLFFVISGFLIVTLLLRERRRTGGVSLKGFYARRTLRIFPLYFGLIALLGVATLFMGPGSYTREAFRHDLPWLVTYTGNWVALASILAIAWSLAAEEQFYVCWPPLEKLLPRRVLLGVLIGFLVLIEIVVGARLLDNLGLPERFPPLDGTFAPICLGVLLAHTLHSPRGYAVARRLLGFRAAPALVLAALLAVVALVPHDDITGLPRLSMHLLMAALVCSCVVREDHVLRPVLRFGPIARIGVISYGMYLLHMFAVEIVRRAGWDDLVDFAVCLGLTVVAAEVSFRFYETPFLRLKSRFGSRPPPVSADAPRVVHAGGRDPV